MIQEIVSYAVIGGAFGFVAVRSFRFLFFSTKKKRKNSKCASCSAECALKEFSTMGNCPDLKI